MKIFVNTVIKLKKRIKIRFREKKRLGLGSVSWLGLG